MTNSKIENINVGDIVAVMNGEHRIVDRVGSLKTVSNFEGMIWCERSHYVAADDIRVATESEKSEFTTRENMFDEGTKALDQLKEPEFI